MKQHHSFKKSMDLLAEAYAGIYSEEFDKAQPTSDDQLIDGEEEAAEEAEEVNQEIVHFYNDLMKLAYEGDNLHSFGVEGEDADTIGNALQQAIEVLGKYISELSDDSDREEGPAGY